MYRIEFRREKETKNTVRFQEVEQVGKPPVVGTLYVQKWAVGPQETLTVEIHGIGPDDDARR